ncbi:MAG: prolipoprotein diacylglyceryl transferase [Ignavibacteriales bacterium]|nr:prolipoprotein diacylglyceryl transferase [Ignavibacteriales bacterium]MCF8306476.1 prolipoprotein diacylglyceryl transferase [Ignavibacteriales bacterium]MCF8316958.1 prolipoprotein diacylglyceryl transferase [Ignavibacteriales bacterium]MCF8437767.1 prolipoprotein diacylglyceryl transferase [Ignavibacteriales bacterium]
MSVINWNISPEIFSIGFITVRWYGILFAAGFLAGYQIMTKIFRWESKNPEDVNDLLWFVIIGTVVGARLGHCLFYNPEYYLTNPLEIIKVWNGGLASHGAAIGILSAVWYYSKKKKNQSYLWVMDRVVITAALGGALIRLGNLFNSEIIGTPTDLPWGFVFERVDDVVRHPAQLYESIAYFIVFGIIYKLYLTKKERTPQGTIFGLFLILVFSFRFFVEFIKENQTYFEEGLLLNMGQLLSIPLVLLGFYLLFRKNISTNQKGTN